MSTSEDLLDFSIVTPSYNSFKFLPRACASVADQTGVTHEHFVVDAVSTDGTVDWLKSQSGVTAVIEKDDGMYDAINTGLKRSRGQYVAYLNCDEQYLPGALAAVKKAFVENPQIDVVFGNVLVVDPQGKLLAFRKVQPPRRSFILSSHLYVFSAAMFIRRRVIESGFFFDKSFRFIGDAEFVVRMMNAGIRMTTIPYYTSVFGITGENISMSPKYIVERQAFYGQSPLWVRWLRRPLNVARLAEKALSGAYREKLPINYAIYTPDNLLGRTHFSADAATYRWPDWNL